MKYYKAEEVAKKLNVSVGHVYELIKRGEINKIDSIGRSVRIPSSELKKVSNKDYCFPYNPEKIEVIETSKGKIRKIKGEDLFEAWKIKNKKS